jgi:hypothetical protein
MTHHYSSMNTDEGISNWQEAVQTYVNTQVEKNHEDFCREFSICHCRFNEISRLHLHNREVVSLPRRSLCGSSE